MIIDQNSTHTFVALWWFGVVVQRTKSSYNTFGLRVVCGEAQMDQVQIKCEAIFYLLHFSTVPHIWIIIIILFNIPLILSICENIIKMHLIIFYHAVSNGPAQTNLISS